MMRMFSKFILALFLMMNTVVTDAAFYTPEVYVNDDFSEEKWMSTGEWIGNMPAGYKVGRFGDTGISIQPIDNKLKISRSGSGGYLELVRTINNNSIVNAPMIIDYTISFPAGALFYGAYGFPNLTDSTYTNQISSIHSTDGGTPISSDFLVVGTEILLNSKMEYDKAYDYRIILDNEQKTYSIFKKLSTEVGFEKLITQTNTTGVFPYVSTNATGFSQMAFFASFSDWAFETMYIHKLKVQSIEQPLENLKAKANIENNAENIPTDKSLELTFNTTEFNRIIPSTLDGVRIKEGDTNIPTSLSIIPSAGGEKAVLTPVSGLKHNTTYTAIIPSTIKDGIGQTTVENIISFRTEKHPFSISEVRFNIGTADALVSTKDLIASVGAINKTTLEKPLTMLILIYKSNGTLVRAELKKHMIPIAGVSTDCNVVVAEFDSIFETGMTAKVHIFGDINLLNTVK